MPNPLERRRSRRPARPGRATAATGRAASRRKAMIDAACELFLERGFESTSVGDVVKRSGGLLATLYTWFGSKEGLFEAIVSEIAAHIVEGLDEPDFGALPLDRALRTFGEKFLATVLCSNALRWHRMCVAEGHKFPELREALLRTGSGHVNQRLATYLAAQADAGKLDVADPRRAAQHFFALIKSETHLAAVCGEPVDLKPGDLARQVRLAVDVFLHGYATSPRPKTRRKSRSIR